MLNNVVNKDAGLLLCGYRSQACACLQTVQLREALSAWSSFVSSTLPASQDFDRNMVVGVAKEEQAGRVACSASVPGKPRKPLRYTLRLPKLLRAIQP